MENATSGFNATPQASRLHIALFGRRNVGKSSLFNALAGQPAAIVADHAGTTTDPVRRAIELHPLGPCLLIDTAGYDEADDEIGRRRLQATLDVAATADVALLVTDTAPQTIDLEWLNRLRAMELPVLVVYNKGYQPEHPLQPSVAVDVITEATTRLLREAVISHAPQGDVTPSLTAGLAAPGDVVLLVMPQDRQAPRGRLILPQVQTIRDLLDRECTVVGCTPARLEATLAALAAPPKLMITDSQVFDLVAARCPEGCRLTSFSVLMAAAKGDIGYLADGARHIDRLTPASRVLIAEACTHAPLTEDIGREKLPRILRARVGQSLEVEIRSGKDWPADLSGYDLIIHCGACMFNRRQMLSRIARAREQSVAMTNYGLAIAHLKGILPRVSLPNTDN